MAHAPKYDPPRWIAFEGPIRVGKTTLADILADRLHAERMRDIEANPFLEDFYQEKPGAALAAQMYFLIHRFRQCHALDLTSTARRMVVSDYIFEKDKIFASLNLTDEELTLYDQYFSVLADETPTPDLVIYLQAKPETLRGRIARKNIRFEEAISDDYLESVVRAYEHFFFRYQASDLLVIDTSAIDFVEQPDHLEELMHRLSQPVKGTQYYLPLGSRTGEAGTEGGE